MKLKRLDIHGFKSFYHRTTLVFDEGVTAVVGPNGCGKSNIVDSIKWVMGEQGPKALRGAAMEDVLFAGSEQRGPMGICEVRLTFTNDGSAEIPSVWHGVEEIAVERRMERSRGSDYRLNKKRCRLADVQDLVAGTGVGTGPGGQRAYAIVEQGQIGRIVSAKADERRLLIEEAAGVTRYRTRRRHAERKMAQTRDNLERVADIIGEVESRLRSLRRQAKKAERFREYKAEWRDIGLRAAAFEVLDQRAEVERLVATTARCARALEDATEAGAAAEARGISTALAERAAEEAARAAADALREVESRGRVAEGERAALEREVAALTGQVEAARGEVEVGAERRQTLETERARAAAGLAELESAAGDERGQLSAADAEHRAARAALLEARAEVERLRRVRAEAVHAAARARAELERQRGRTLDLGERAAAAGEERAAVEAAFGQLEAAASGAREEMGAAELAIAAAEERGEAAEARAEALDEIAQLASAEERGLVERGAGLRSRRHSLMELERSREGLGEGTRAILEAAPEGALGPLSAALEVPAELEQAVAGVLGELLGGVLVEDLSCVPRALEVLEERRQGRAVLVARASVDGARPSSAGGEALAARLGDGLAARLVGDAVLVEDLQTALAAAAHSEVPLVSRDGQVVRPGGVVVGGPGGADAAPLSRRREIRALSEELASVTEAREQAAARLAEAQAAARVARAEAGEAGRAAQRARVARAEAAKDLQRARGEVERARADSGRLARTVAELQAQAEEAAERAAVAAERLEEVGEEDAAQAEAIHQAARRAERTEQAREGALAALHRLQTQVAARRERVEGVRGAVQRIDHQLGEIAQRVGRAGQVEGRVRARLAEIAATRVDAEAAIALASSGAVEEAGALSRARARLAEASGASKAAEAEAAGGRRAVEGARQALSEARLGEQAGVLRAEHLGVRVEERYGLPVERLLAHTAEAARPVAEEAARLEQLEALLQKMGDVNLNAIEEHAQVAARFDFLSTQRDDLNAALADLEVAIEQIDRTSRHLFKETFEAVNEHFQVIFPRLFRGGTASLALTDPDDLLNTGIEMLVQPPGKKVQSVGLLSGGEKAMCAIALVFSVFRVKPSPFCLLDEVDAPLDEANIGRFNEIVREMAQTSQILLITHNKRTMEIADVLYGITMEEPGVSKLVSVRMA